MPGHHRTTAAVGDVMERRSLREICGRGLDEVMERAAATGW